MKKLLLITAIALISFTSCKKDFVIPERTLIGTWVSNSPVLQFPITNTTGAGASINFLEYKENGVSYLKVTYPEGVDVYEVVHIGKGELYLKDAAGLQIGFYRVAD